MNFVLRPDVYPIKIGVWIGPWRAQPIAKFLHEERLYRGEIIEAPDDSNAACCYNFNGASLIWLPTRPRSSYQIAMLAHEATHAAINAGEQLGFKLSQDSDEFPAYLVQYIVESVLRKIRK